MKIKWLTVTSWRPWKDQVIHVSVLINNEIIQMRNDASEYSHTHRSKHPKAFSRRCRCGFSVDDPPVFNLKPCVTLLPEFSTSQMCDRNDLIPAQDV